MNTRKNGITFQLYVAVIGVLMMHIHSGKRVSIYTLAALGRVARGQMSLKDAMIVIHKRDKEPDKERERQARRRAVKKSV